MIAAVSPSPILAPVVALVAWSLVMLVWAVSTRIRALKVKGIDLSNARGGRPGQLDGFLPDEAQWKAHNYNHLMEQPTLFYAICAVLAIAGAGGGAAVWLAWAYVALRIAHSLVQATANIIRYRLTLFTISTGVLVALTVIAAMRVCG